MYPKQGGQSTTVVQAGLLLRLPREPTLDQRQLLDQRLPESELQGEQLRQQQLQRRQSEGQRQVPAEQQTQIDDREVDVRQFDRQPVRFEIVEAEKETAVTVDLSVAKS